MGAYLYSRPPRAVQPFDAVLPRPAAAAAFAMSGLRVTCGEPGDDIALVRFGFAGEPADVVVACPRLAGPATGETWLETGVGDGEFALVAIEVEEAALGGVQAASEEAYRRLLAAVRPSNHPYLLRIWNYVGAINAGAGDDERYRRFCVGRA